MPPFFFAHSPFMPLVPLCFLRVTNGMPRLRRRAFAGPTEMSAVHAPDSDDIWSTSIGNRVVLVCLCLVLALAVTAGGSARPDIIGLLFVRLAAVVAIALLLLATPVGQLRRTLLVARFGLVAVALVAVQLVPLPPALWGVLPGHADYAAMAEAAVGPVWRPLTMTPDLTVNALLALLPGIAVALCAAVQSRALRAPMLMVLVVCALGSALLGLTQLAAGDGTPLRWYPITNDSSAVGIFANRNHHAVFLASAMPAVAAWSRIGTMKLRRGQTTRPYLFGTIAACTAFAAMAIATGSRFGIVASAIGAIGAAVLYLAGRPTERLPALGARTKAATGVAMLAILGAAGLLAALPGSGLRRILSEGVGDDSRAAWLAPLYEMAMTFMPFGVWVRIVRQRLSRVRAFRTAAPDLSQRRAQRSRPDRD